MSTKQSSYYGEVESLRRRRKRKPKDMPKRPLSAYNLFFAEERERIFTAQQQGIEQADFIFPNKDENGPLKQEHQEKDEEVTGIRKKRKAPVLFQALATCVGKRWKSLSDDDKKKYQSKAEIEMQKYRKRMDEYQRAVVTDTITDAAAASSSPNKRKKDLDEESEKYNAATKKPALAPAPPTTDTTMVNMQASDEASGEAAGTGLEASAAGGDVAGMTYYPSLGGVFAGRANTGVVMAVGVPASAAPAMAPFQQRFREPTAVSPGTSLLQASAGTGLGGYMGVVDPPMLLGRFPAHLQVEPHQFVTHSFQNGLSDSAASNTTAMLPLNPFSSFYPLFSMHGLHQTLAGVDTNFSTMPNLNQSSLSGLPPLPIRCSIMGMPTGNSVMYRGVLPRQQFVHMTSGTMTDNIGTTTRPNTGLLLLPQQQPLAAMAGLPSLSQVQQQQSQFPTISSRISFQMQQINAPDSADLTIATRERVTSTAIIRHPSPPPL